MSSKGWSLEGVAYDPVALAREGVQYRGQLYPREFTAGFTRGDGLKVDLVVTVDTADGPTPKRAAMEHPGGLAGVDRIAFLKLARIAAASVGLSYEGKRTWTARDPNVDELQIVADSYREALKTGRRIPPAVREALESKGIYRAEATIPGLVHKARRTEGPDGETYLPPTEPGRKRA